MSLGTYVFRDGPLTSIRSTAHTRLLFVQAHSDKEANEIMENILSQGKSTYFSRISFTGASYTNATKTINAAGAFTDYTYVSGDQVTLTAGTGSGFSLGTYSIASRTDDNNIVLSAAIGGNGSGVAGYLNNIQRIDWTDSENYLVGIAKARLSTSKAVSVTNGTWTVATKTFTSANAFTSYTFTRGDILYINSGTDVTRGPFEIAGKTDNSNITLTENIADSNLSTGDISADVFQTLGRGGTHPVNVPGAVFELQLGAA